MVRVSFNASLRVGARAIVKVSLILGSMLKARVGARVRSRHFLS